MTDQEQGPPRTDAHQRLAGAVAVVSWAALLGYYLVWRTLLASGDKDRLEILTYYGVFVLGSLAAALVFSSIASVLKRRAGKSAKPPRAMFYIFLSVALFYGSVSILSASGQTGGNNALTYTMLTPLFCGGMALYFCRRHAWRPATAFYFSVLVSVAHFHAVWIAMDVYGQLGEWKTVLAGQERDVALAAAGFCAGAAGAGLSLFGLWPRGVGFRSLGAVAVSMLVLGVVGAVGLPLAVEVDKGIKWFHSGVALYVPWQAVFGVILAMLHGRHRRAPSGALV